ncbi:DUF5004 domain-containing protein [Pontibacter sp. G13]|uniref:DUF5004 domain-containing protein n=1 Tax=Pontibacter sp. G13 TaxID=3074898 RepID=UPI002889B24E|nr:DUF5004 domain-containing protein [Pontibacter sp. G13]WNJ19237.1 DUF5004 domain-containing protein [Pontibacter sp. G13]
MKKIHIPFLMLLVGLFMTACDNNKNYEFGEPYSKLEGIADTWELTSVEQVDKLTLSADSTLDVSSVFLKGTPMTLAFNSSEMTVVVEAGDSPQLLIGGGSWSFDDDEYPTAIILNANGVEQTLRMLKTIRTVDETLEFQVSRSFRGQSTVGYNFTFVRQN